MSALWGLVVVLVVYLYVKDRIRNKKLYDFSERIPGPKVWPVLGSTLEFAGKDNAGIFNKFVEYGRTYTRFCKFWNAGQFFILVNKVQDIETVLADNTNIAKSDFYKFIIPWIGYGLLTSKGSKWRKHRKIITPTFFFKILEDFLEVFNRNGQIMCNCLQSEVGKGTFNMFNYVNRAALDNICETAMGVDFNVQRTQDSSYLQAVKTICNTAALRLYLVWLMPDILFKYSSYGSKQRAAIEFIHDSTRKLIKEKRKAIAEKQERGEIQQGADDDFTTKKKTAFLDLLLESAGTQLTDDEINDEVNTFMFEGHDTVSSSTSFALYELSVNPEIQEKLYDEQMEILGDADNPLTIKDISEMKYMDKVVKETLRLYPSVPMIGREIEEDMKLKDGMTIPRGTNVLVSFYNLHRDPETWPNPENFDPENFNADLNTRHPFAYVPFSAGSRNCIGQKFALLEMKVIVSYIVRNFKLLPCSDEEKVTLANDLVLISKNGQNMRLVKRD